MNNKEQKEPKAEEPKRYQLYRAKEEVFTGVPQGTILFPLQELEEKQFAILQNGGKLNYAIPYEVVVKSPGWFQPLNMWYTREELIKLYELTATKTS
jgi:hypothetical protein